MKKLATKTISFVKEPSNLAQLGFYIFTGFLLLYSVFGDHGFIKLQQYKSMKSDLTLENIQLKANQNNLLQQRELLNSPRYLETIIREELGYVKPDEVLFEWLKND